MIRPRANHPDDVDEDQLEFIEELSSQEDYAIRFSRALSRDLRDGRMTSAVQAQAITSLCGLLVSSRTFILASYSSLPDHHGLLPSLMIFCNRQICGGAEKTIVISVLNCVDMMRYLLSDPRFA